MVNKRLQLQTKLEELLGSKSVYYQAPPNRQLTYPCIIYSKEDIDIKKADNSNYISRIRYQIIIIDKRPDNNVIDKILELPYASYDRPYISDNLYHDVIIIYL